MTRTLVVVPARGGSKGVPGKNLREVAGKPLLVWTVEQALELAATPDVGPVVVVVSTDDPGIAEVAQAAGAEVVDRPAALATDEAPTEPAVLHALDTVDATGRPADRVLLLQATSPVRLPGTLARALHEAEATGVDALVGVVPQAPFLWRLPAGADGAPTAAYDVARRPRRQDLTDGDLAYRETGSLYLTDVAVWRAEQNRVGGRVGLFVMAEIEGTDVDTELDLAVAEARLRTLV